MKIQFKNSPLDTRISVDDDMDEDMLMITTVSQENESWHSFTSMKQIDDFIVSLIVMRNRIAKKIGGKVIDNINE